MTPEQIPGMPENIRQQIIRAGKAYARKLPKVDGPDVIITHSDYHLGDLLAFTEGGKVGYEAGYTAALTAQGEQWGKLAAIGPPEKWIEVCAHYQELLTQADTANWYAEQFDIANRERDELKEALRQQIENNKAVNKALDEIKAELAKLLPTPPTL